MRIIDANWTAKVIMIKIECECGRRFDAPADKKIIRCRCLRKGDMLELKSDYEEERGKIIGI